MISEKQQRSLNVLSEEKSEDLNLKQVELDMRTFVRRGKSQRDSCPGSQGDGRAGPSAPAAGVARLLRQFADDTSIQGVPRILQAQSCVRRVVWSLVVMVNVVMFSAQFTQLLSRYFSYPKKVTIEVVSGR